MLLLPDARKKKLKVAREVINNNHLQTYILDNQNKEQLQNFFQDSWEL